MLSLAQFLVTYISVRSVSFAAAVRSEPALLVRDGKFCERAMRRERVTKGEALSAIRASGNGRLDDVESLILESDGSLSVTLHS